MSCRLFTSWQSWFSRPIGKILQEVCVRRGHSGGGKQTISALVAVQMRCSALSQLMVVVKTTCSRYVDLPVPLSDFIE
jgi:hypothetical protein